MRMRTRDESILLIPMGPVGLMRMESTGHDSFLWNSSSIAMGKSTGMAWWE